MFESVVVNAFLNASCVSSEIASDLTLLGQGLSFVLAQLLFAHPVGPGPGRTHLHDSYTLLLGPGSAFALWKVGFPHSRSGLLGSVITLPLDVV